MNRPLQVGVANLSAPGVARCLGFMRGLFRTAVRYARDRRAARQADRDLRYSGRKLTDEMERQMTERFSRNRSFRL